MQFRGLRYGHCIEINAKATIVGLGFGLVFEVVADFHDYRRIQ